MACHHDQKQRVRNGVLNPGQLRSRQIHSDEVAEQDGEICLHSSAQIGAVCFHHLQYLETGHTKLGTAGAKEDYFYGGYCVFGAHITLLVRLKRVL